MSLTGCNSWYGYIVSQPDMVKLLYSSDASFVVGQHVYKGPPASITRVTLRPTTFAKVYVNASV